MPGTVALIRRSMRGLVGGAALSGVVILVGTAAPAVAAPATDVIVLPGAGSAEGVAVGRGATFYAGELFGGDIFRGNLQRGTVEPFIDAPDGQMAVGLKVDDASGLLFVAGGDSGQGVVYDAATGAIVATYQFTLDPSFINDVVITKDGAWFTDSLQPNLYFVPIGPTGVPGDFSVLALTGPAADISGDFNLNGIAATPDGRTLIVGHSGNEALYTVDPVTGASALLADEVLSPDGLLYEAGRLWVAQPFLNQIARLRVSPDLTSAVVDRIITSENFQTPTTIAIHGNVLAAVNAKFDTGVPPTADQYEVVIVERQP
jgi:sugar lactone lactonase YvrE